MMSSGSCSKLVNPWLLRVSWSKLANRGFADVSFGEGLNSWHAFTITPYQIKVAEFAPKVAGCISVPYGELILNQVATFEVSEDDLSSAKSREEAACYG